MSSKIINVILVCFFSLCMAGKANAGLIVGELYEDADEAGLYWEYVGSFDLTGGIDVFSDEIGGTYNGIEAALMLFDTLLEDEIALSSNKVSDYVNAADFLVNHHAWYDTYYSQVAAGQNGVKSYREDILADINGNNLYDYDGDISTYIWDRAEPGANINYVFKSVTTSVPEPSTLILFSLTLIGLVARRFKMK